MNLQSLFSDYQTLPEYSELVLDSVSCVSLFGDQPIHVAATRGAIDELTVLLENGANINVPGEHGYRPLHDAVEQGHVEAVRWLLRNGADRSLRSKNNLSPFDLAELLGEIEIAEILRE